MKQPGPRPKIILRKNSQLPVVKNKNKTVIPSASHQWISFCPPSHSACCPLPAQLPVPYQMLDALPLLCSTLETRWHWCGGKGWLPPTKPLLPPWWGTVVPCWRQGWWPSIWATPAAALNPCVFGSFDHGPFWHRASPPEVVTCSDARRLAVKRWCKSSLHLWPGTVWSL